MSQLPTVWYQQDGSLCYKDGAVLLDSEPSECVCGGVVDPPNDCCAFPYSVEPNFPGGGVLCSVSGSWSVSDLDQMDGANGTVIGSNPLNQFSMSFNIGGILTAQPNGSDPPCYTYDLFTTTPGAFNGGIGRLFGPFFTSGNNLRFAIYSCSGGSTTHINPDGSPLIIPESGPFPYVYLSSNLPSQQIPYDYYVYLRAGYNPTERALFTRVSMLAWRQDFSGTKSLGNAAVYYGHNVQIARDDLNNYSFDGNPHYGDGTFDPIPEGVCVDCVNITVDNPLHTRFTAEGHIQTGCAYPVNIQDACPGLQGNQSLVIEKKRETNFAYTVNINGFHACDPDNIPPAVVFPGCDLNPPPPPPPPPPPTQCCTQSYSCRPTDESDPPQINLNRLIARLEYRVDQDYTCNQPNNPEGIPQQDTISRSWDQTISDGSATLIPESAQGVCPRYHKQYVLDASLQGLISNGCSAGGFAIAPSPADSILMRMIVDLWYYPGTSTLRLAMALRQLTAGGGNPVSNDVPYAVFSANAELRGGYSPPYDGSVLVGHRGIVREVPGPVPPGGSLPVVPPSPPGQVGGDSPGVYGGWRVYAYTEACHTMLHIDGAALFVPTGDVIRGSGTTRDEVRVGFRLEAAVGGIEECPDEGQQQSPAQKRTKRQQSIIEPAGCPVCGSMRDYSRCGAPCMNKACSYSSGCGGM